MYRYGFMARDHLVDILRRCQSELRRLRFQYDDCPGSNLRLDVCADIERRIEQIEELLRVERDDPSTRPHGWRGKAGPT